MCAGVSPTGIHGLPALLPVTISTAPYPPGSVLGEGVSMVISGGSQLTSDTTRAGVCQPSPRSPPSSLQTVY